MNAGASTCGFTQPISAGADAPARRTRDDASMKGVAKPSTSRTPRLINPALAEHARERARSFENRVADHITEFSGSMRFV